MKTILLVCAIALATSGSALAQQKATLFNDHQGVNETSQYQGGDKHVIALQTTADVRGETAQFPHWSNSLSDYQRPAYASTRTVQVQPRRHASDVIYTAAYTK